MPSRWSWVYGRAAFLSGPDDCSPPGGLELLPARRGMASLVPETAFLWNKKPAIIFIYTSLIMLNS